MTRQLAAQLARDWLDLRALWAEIPEAERSGLTSLFLLSEATLMTASFDDLVAAYEARGDADRV